MRRCSTRRRQRVLPVGALAAVVGNRRVGAHRRRALDHRSEQALVTRVLAVVRRRVARVARIVANKKVALSALGQNG